VNRKAIKSIIFNASIVLVVGGLSGPVGAHDMETHGWKTGNGPASQKVYWLRGRVNDASEQNGLVNVTHDPVKELSWPSMTMTFHVSDKALFAKMHPRDSIDFALKEVGGNRYEIVDVKGRD
jgi:Cu(I)/Ag(I) efflux system periplasmic protein CusF